MGLEYTKYIEFEMSKICSGVNYYNQRDLKSATELDDV